MAESKKKKVAKEESEEEEVETKKPSKKKEKKVDTDSEEEVETKPKKSTKAKSTNKTTTSSSSKGGDEAKKERTILRAGNLYLVASEARALSKKNIFSKNKSDPFSEVRILNQEELDTLKAGKKLKEKEEDNDQVQRMWRSRVVKKNLDPHWNEGSKLFSINEKDVAVQVILWNSNRFLSNDFMGQITFQLPQINDGVPHEDWYQLKPRDSKKEKVKGEIHLQLLFLDQDDKITGEEFKYPLQTFLKKRRMDIIEQIFENHKNQKAFNIEKLDANEYTPLHIACESNVPQGVQLLLDHGASVNAKGGEFKQTPLHRACTASPESAKLLIEAGADIAAKDSKDQTPLHIAGINDQPTTIKLLLKKGADIDRQDADGNTSLHSAIQNRAFQAMKLLVESGADIYVRNKNQKTAGEVAAAIDEETKQIFMDAVGVEDYLEIALLENWKGRVRIDGEGLNYDWKKSPQFVIIGEAKTQFKVLVHHKKQPDNTQLSYCVVTADNRYYKQPSLTELVGYGSSEPFAGKLGEDPKMAHSVIIPYAKAKDCPDKFSVLVFTKPGDDVKLKQLKEWSHETSIDGEWKGKTAGGAQSPENEKTWHKNPFFTLTLPSDKKDKDKSKGKVEVSILLSQKQTFEDAASLVPYQMIPYPFFIGFYLFDSDVEDLIGQCRKWKNAKEVFTNFTLDTSKGNQYTIVPTTFKSKEETTFTIRVLSSVPVKLKKFADSDN